MLNCFYGAFIRTQYWYLFYNMPLESIQIDFSNKTYAIRKKIHTFFLLLRSSILKLDYICDCSTSIFDFWYQRIPMNYLSNAIGLTWFGLFKAKLCPIARNDLIMDWFNRANLYDLPRVTVSSFGSEIYRQETKIHVLPANFYSIPIWCSERELWIFSHDHLFEMKFGSLKNT